MRELLSGLGQVTPEGTCFRVDANLRPEGRNGPLSRTLGSYQAYWDRWAQPWELQALVKVRPVAGEAAWLADAYRLCLRARNLAYLVAGRPVESLPTDPRALDRLARAMGEPGRQRLLEAYRRATRRAHRVVVARFWEDAG